MQLNGNSKLSESDWSQQAPVTAALFRKLWHVPCPSRSLEPIRCHAFDGSAYNRSLGFLFPPCLFKRFEVVITRAGAWACTWKGRLHYWWHVTPSSPEDVLFLVFTLRWNMACQTFDESKNEALWEHSSFSQPGTSELNIHVNWNNFKTFGEKKNKSDGFKHV